MNLNFKVLLFLILLFSNSKLIAKDFVLITYEYESRTLKMLKSSLKDQIKLDQRFVKIKRSSMPCKANKSVFLHMCIDDKNEVRVLHQDQVALASLRDLINVNN